MINIDQLTIGLGSLLQRISKKVDQLAEMMEGSINLLEEEVELIVSILHQVWDMEESTMESASWLGETLHYVRQGEVDPNDLPDVIRNLKKNLDLLPDEYCTFFLDAKSGHIQNVEISPI
ncbi:hypothetical protein ACFQ49_02850 [Kroppenstedtia eburnea]|uniref:Uncharacterized protein n=1 Tax=Kroppenstedtia eburnea TaxID=714067 RepID=A0A1N7P1T8_9BACL|nr:hypothetical protein [Kroppenstedtia eburnea]EGK09146.1 hypothetical protein HMPREF9374_3000 [Desmospora sp. 8437]QKI80887.1 hypothetical protein GXN75_02105 [Kroppenstedtia eburnea]SIT04543.1 hypothetical protein SAMN05421790_11114 [Kroppenstedtia eburnea]